MQTVTGMVYDNGKLYYSLAGQSQLRYRYFEPDDGVIGSVEFTAGGTANLEQHRRHVPRGQHALLRRLRPPATCTRSRGPAATRTARPTRWSAVRATDGNDWRTRGMFATAAPAPVASFTATCTGLTCSFDASASTAPGSSITSYSWTFGDGNTGTGVTATNTYARRRHLHGHADRDERARRHRHRHRSRCHRPRPRRRSRSSPVRRRTANATTETVTVPAAVTQGDGMLLIATGTTATAPTAPAGWTLVGTLAVVHDRHHHLGLAAGRDRGRTRARSVSVGFGAIVHGTVQLVAYSGTNATNPVASFAVIASASVDDIGHVADRSRSAASGDWVVTYWAAKSSTVTTWTVPGHGPPWRGQRQR